MDAKTFFDQRLPQVFQTVPDKAKELNAIYVFKISGTNGGTWTVDLRATPPTISTGDRADADCTVEAADTDFETLLADSQQGMQLFMEGKLKVSDPMLGTRLVDLIDLA